MVDGAQGRRDVGRFARGGFEEFLQLGAQLVPAFLERAGVPGEALVFRSHVRQGAQRLFEAAALPFQGFHGLGIGLERPGQGSPQVA